MSTYDYIIVGAGSAGCALAEKLSANPNFSILLLEAGPKDSNPLLHIPKGFGKTFSNSSLTWRYDTERKMAILSCQETWLRGKTLGGSSSLNGMVYNRGQPGDYDGWAALGNDNWGWRNLAAHFDHIEHFVSSRPSGNPICEAVIKAGIQKGLPRRDGFDGLGCEGIGHIAFTIKNGKRMSAARIFLDSARKRPNLHVATETLVKKVLFDNKKAVGVSVSTGHNEKIYTANREVILAAGALESPKLLQLSGIGPANHLRELGIDVVVDNPCVGKNLREHFLLGMQFRVNSWHYSNNRDYSGLRLWRHALHYALTRRGLLSTGSHDVAAFARVCSETKTPDAQIMLTPTSRNFTTNRIAFENEPGIQIFGYVLRPQSQGSLLIRSADPHLSPRIKPNYLSAEYDRKTSVALVKYIRDLTKTPELRSCITQENRPGTEYSSDEEILKAFEKYGQSGFHTIGTCKMGIDEDAVVDQRLRVRGVEGIRVVDCSIFPTMISGNPNGPMMAIACRASELILQDSKR